MENVSKALLIAGGVLIAMIIASFGVYLYGVYHSHAENVMNRLTESQITEFNAKFTAFEGRDLTANEVISIINMVRENNTTRESVDYQISVAWIDYASIIQPFKYRLETFKITDSNKDELATKSNNFIKDFSNADPDYEMNQYTFIVTVAEYSNVTGLVKKLNIQPKKNY